MTDDLISRRAAIDALWEALYEYEDKTKKQFQESDELDVEDWIEHRIFVQNMSDIDRQTIMELPSSQPEQKSDIEEAVEYIKNAQEYLRDIGETWCANYLSDAIELLVGERRGES